jgi:preprotein translocase subunit YajC
MTMTILVHLADLMIAQAETPGKGGEGGGGLFGGGLVGMLPLLLMFLVIYFLLIRPAGKQRREHAELLNALKKDDEVVTSGGIYGKIVGLEDRIITLEIADKVKIKILRDRIAGRWAPAQSLEKK